MKYKILTIVLGLMFGLSSCNDLDLVPLSEGSTGSWYSTVEELDMAVKEFYLLGYWNSVVEASEQWTDNFTYRNSHRMDILYGTMNGEVWQVGSLWEQNYKLIARANSLLDGIHRAEENGVNQTVINGYKGQAYFARACKYATLISYFGDVVYLNKPVELEVALTMSRTSKDEVIPLVYDDFDKAIELLPISYGSDVQFFTKGAAMAMKARFALYNGDWEIAAAAAADCIELNQYELYPDFSELFLASTKNANENIFAIPRSAENNVLLDQWVVNNQLSRNAGGYGASTPSWDLLASFLCTDGLPIDESPLFDSHNPFKNRDPRCTKTIVEFQTQHLGFDYNPLPDALTVMNYTTGLLQKNNDTRAVAQYASFNGLLWKKGVDETWLANSRKVESDYVIIRYAEVLLTYAESKIELNDIDESVLNAINQVRARAYGVGVAETSKYPAVSSYDQSTLRKTVRLERRVEFANENLRYMDLVRWRLATKALNTKNYGLLYPSSLLIDKVTSKGLWFWPSIPQIDEDGIADFSEMENAGQISVLSQRVWAERQYLWPLPTSEIQVNKNLVQNPEY